MLRVFACITTGCLLSAPLAAFGAEDSSSIDQRMYAPMVAKAMAYLETKGQSADGSYSGFSGPGVTALATTALMRHGRPRTARQWRKASATWSNSCVRMVASTERERFTATTRPAWRCSVSRTSIRTGGMTRSSSVRTPSCGAFSGASTAIDASDFSYGGAGYGSHKRPDLSNTSFFIDALKAMDHGSDDPAIQRALVFISRCQNLESEHNTTPFSTKNPDGGFYYTPAAGGTSQAGRHPQGGCAATGR